MTTDDHRAQDNIPLWMKDGLPFSGLSRFSRWLFPALTAAGILILVVTLGVISAKTSSRLWSVEQNASNLSDVIQSLNASLQEAREKAKEIQKMQFAVERNKDELISVSQALKQLSVVDSLSRSVASLKCSLNHIINNNHSPVTGCCPLGWLEFEFSCYFFSSSSASWNESRVWCENNGAQLLILHSDKAWDFVIQHTVPESFWVGLSNWRTGRWEWINQTPYTMERRRWLSGKPDTWASRGRGRPMDCAHLHSIGRLNNRHCDFRLRYICQRHSMH